MEKQKINFEANLFSRNKMNNMIKGMTNEQLTQIPTGLNHHIIWHIAHAMVMQQLVIYKASGLNMTIKDEIVYKYKTGSFATPASDMEIEYILDNLFKSLEQVKTDYKSGNFKNYNPFTTKAEVSVNSIEDAISFHTFHEGIHLGRIMEIRKLV